MTTSNLYPTDMNKCKKKNTHLISLNYQYRTDKINSYKAGHVMSTWLRPKEGNPLHAEQKHFFFF